jgi:hypothetical protein
MPKSKYRLRNSFDHRNHRVNLTTDNNLNITLVLPGPNTLFQTYVPHLTCFRCPYFTDIYPPRTTFIFRSPVVPERVIPSSRLGSTSSAVRASAAVDIKHLLSRLANVDVSSDVDSMVRMSRKISNIVPDLALSKGLLLAYCSAEQISISQSPEK